MRGLATAFMGLGLVLIVLSWFCPNRSSDAVWTKDQAEDRTKLTAKLHGMRAAAAAGNKTHPGHDSHGPPPSDAELKSTEEQFARSNADLDSARSARSRIARYLFWSGLVIAVGGLACYGYGRITKS